MEDFLDFLILVLVAVLVATLIVGVIGLIIPDEEPSLATYEPLSIPDGFEFLGASAYGQYFEVRTVYLKSKIGGNVFGMDEDGVLTPIFVPEGYEFLDASAYGQYFEVPTYYLRHLESGQIYMYHLR